MIAAPPPFVIAAPAAVAAARPLELRLTRRGPLGRVVVYAPPGWRTDLTLPTGSPIGLVHYRDAAGRREAALAVTDPARPETCTPGPHAAVWAPRVEPGPTVFVDTTTPAEASLGGYRLEACLGSTVSLAARFASAVFANPLAVGLYTWRAIVAPPAPAAPYELQSQVPVPHTLTVGVRSGRVRGRLTFEGLAEQGARVRVYSVRGRLLGATTTRGDGRFALRRRLHGIRRVVAATLARPAACKQPTLPRCTATVAPASSSRP